MYIYTYIHTYVCISVETAAYFATRPRTIENVRKTKTQIRRKEKKKKKEKNLNNKHNNSFSLANPLAPLISRHTFAIGQWTIPFAYRSHAIQIQTNRHTATQLQRYTATRTRQYKCISVLPLFSSHSLLHTLTPIWCCWCCCCSLSF